MSESIEWQDDTHGFRVGASYTELYAATANALDRIEVLMRTDRKSVV